eukprot:6182688-Pleurochrysis_carterae.AAC.1
MPCLAFQMQLQTSLTPTRDHSAPALTIRLVYSQMKASMPAATINIQLKAPLIVKFSKGGARPTTIMRLRFLDSTKFRGKP